MNGEFSLKQLLAVLGEQFLEKLIYLKSGSQ